MRPLPLRAALAPCGSVAPPASAVVVGAIPVTSQCVNIPPGASGSSTRIATLCVPAGTRDHASGGVVCVPSQVYLRGISWFAPNALEVT